MNRPKLVMRTGCAIASLIVLASCTTHHTSAVPTRTPIASRAEPVGRGTITGLLTASGGPVGALRPLPGVVTAVPTGATGTVQSMAKVYTATVGPDGRYSISLPVGGYSVTGRSPLYQNGNTGCLVEMPVVVRSGRLSTANVVCIEKASD